jgi:hypothetical protein
MKKKLKGLYCCAKCVELMKLVEKQTVQETPIVKIDRKQESIIRYETVTDKAITVEYHAIELDVFGPGSKISLEFFNKTDRSAIMKSIIIFCKNVDKETPRTEHQKLLMKQIHMANVIITGDVNATGNHTGMNRTFPYSTEMIYNALDLRSQISNNEYLKKTQTQMELPSPEWLNKYLRSFITNEGIQWDTLWIYVNRMIETIGLERFLYSTFSIEFDEQIIVSRSTFARGKLYGIEQEKHILKSNLIESEGLKQIHDSKSISYSKKTSAEIKPILVNSLVVAILTCITGPDPFICPIYYKHVASSKAYDINF